VIVQGLGNVGYYSAKFFQDGGATIVGIGEYEGAIYNANGLDVDAVFNHRKSSGSILNFPGATNINATAEILEQPCDILIPAALENVIHEGNASKIKAKIIGEAANGPVTAEADDILTDMGVMIVPDMYLNAGGVTVSYFEWLKNLSHVRFGRLQKRFEQGSNSRIVEAIEELTGKKLNAVEVDKIIKGPDEIDLVRSGLEETMINSYHAIRNEWKSNAACKNLRTAAFVVAINKIASDYLALGIFPLINCSKVYFVPVFLHRDFFLPFSFADVTFVALLSSYSKTKRMTISKIQLFISVLLLSASLQAQVFSGKVLDAKTAETLPFVSIGIPGKSVGTVAQLDGSFNITISDIYNNDSIRFSIIGYEAKKMLVSEFKALATAQKAVIKLQPQDEILSEVMIRPRDMKSKILGNEFDSPSITAGFTSDDLGSEIGTVMKLKDGKIII
jgi:hypothetical protein